MTETTCNRRTTFLAGLALAACLSFAAGPVWAGCTPEDPVAALRAAVSQPARLADTARRIGKALDGGCYFGREAAIARAVAPIWQACPQDPETHSALNSLFAPITTAVHIEDRQLALSLFVETPLACLERRPEDWDRWFPGLHLLTTPGFSDAAPQAVTRLMKVAEGRPQYLAQLVRRLGGLHFADLPAFTPDWIDRIMDHANSPDDIWGLRVLFARIPGRAGTEALLRFAEREHFAIAPDLLPDNPASFIARMRGDAIRRLGDRKLTPDDLRRVAALALADEDLIADSAIGVLAKHKETLRLPGKVLDRLAYRMRLSETACRRIAGILATQGRAGAERIHAYWLKVREGRARDCGWDLEQALRASAPHLRAEWVQRYHATKDARLIPYLVAAGETGLVAEIARTVPDAKVRGEAVRQLAAYLPDHPDDVKAREALRRAALEALNPDAWRALLKVKDPKADWNRLAAMLRRETPDRERLLRMFPEPAPRPVLEALLDLAAGATTNPPLHRILAIQAALRTPKWALSELSASYMPAEKAKEKAIKDKARAVLQHVYALEPKVRALFDDPDWEIRRAAVGWFAVVPAQEAATTEALLARLDDPNEGVRAGASDAIARMQAAPPGILARLEGRIDPDSRTYIQLLRRDPEALDRLAAVVLHRAGSARQRKALAESGPLAPAMARALLARLAAEPVKALLPQTGLSLADMVGAEEDPPAWALISRLVPDALRNEWLVKRAEDPKLGWDLRLRLLLMISGETPEAARERLRSLWMEALRADAVSAPLFLSGFVRQFGYEGIQALADASWGDPARLERLADLWIKAKNLSGMRAATGSGGAGTPAPSKEHLPWIARRVKALADSRDARRLRAFLTVANLYALTHDGTLKLQRAAYEAGITPALLRHIDDPEWCRAAQPLNALLDRMLPPRC